MKITANQVVSFGTSHVTFDLVEQDSVSVKFVGGLLKGQSFLFNKQKKKVKLGRHSSSDIRINENGLSRCQCILIFDGGNWTLKDGDEHKLSTNGTWLYANSPFTLTNETCFKAGKTVFRVEAKK